LKYNQPFDQPGNPNASYVSGNPSTGTQGSIPPAEAFENPQRELVNFFTDSGITPTNTDLHQLSRSVQSGDVKYAVDTGTANAMVAALQPVPLMLNPGMTLRIKKTAFTNTDAMSLDVGLGANNLVKSGGASLNAGDLPANMVVEVCWDGTQWQCMNYIGIQSSTNTVNNFFAFDIPYCVDAGSAANTIVAPFSPAITAVVSGDLISVKLANRFSGGPVNILVNGIPSIPVKRGDTNNPIFGDGSVGQILLLEYDGNNFQIVNSIVPGSPLPIVLADEKPRGTHCGTFTHGAWRTRDLQTIVDPFGLVAAGLVALGNNRITLAPGKWILDARAPAINVGHHQCRWWSYTHQRGWHKGHFCWERDEDWDNYNRHSWSWIDGLLDLPTTTTFEFQHRCFRDGPIWGFGRHGDDYWHDDYDLPERYAVVYLTKVS